MGTRADFYIGRDAQAEWLGSIGWDGNPSSIPEAVKTATTPEAFRAAVAALQTRDDFTTPAMGWPWPWETSDTTDYAYCFEAGQVYASCFGYPWFDPMKKERDQAHKMNPYPLPNMKARQNVTLGARSGITILRT